jgi:hypothetical protein
MFEDILPWPDIRAINSDPGGCNHTPACGYMPLTIEEVYGKELKGKAVIVDGKTDPTGRDGFFRRLAPIQPARSFWRYRRASASWWSARTLSLRTRASRLDDGERAADRYGPAFSRLREVLQ